MHGEEAYDNEIVAMITCIHTKVRDMMYAHRGSLLTWSATARQGRNQYACSALLVLLCIHNECGKPFGNGRTLRVSRVPTRC